MRRSSSTSQKRVQETPPKSKPQTHQRQEEEGEQGRRGRLKAAGRGGLGSHVPREYIHAGEIYSTVHLLWLSLSHTHTHAHTLADTHVLLSRRSRHPHSQRHTHSHKPRVMKLSGVTSNRRCSALQMVRLTVTFPRSVEDQKSIRKPEGREGGGQDQVDSGSLSPGQIPPAGSESISRGVCSQAAPDYGKVIHLDALPPPPPTLGSLH